jgi:hypothetical protein
LYFCAEIIELIIETHLIFDSNNFSSLSAQLWGQFHANFVCPKTRKKPISKAEKNIKMREIERVRERRMREWIMHEKMCWHLKIQTKNRIAKEPRKWKYSYRKNLLFRTVADLEFAIPRAG